MMPTGVDTIVYDYDDRVCTGRIAGMGGINMGDRSEDRSDLEKSIARLTQMSLFTPGLARSTDPDTSHKAAATVDANKLEKLVVSALMGRPHGCTVKEISGILRIDKWSVSPRMKPLEGKGLIERTAERRDRSIVWRMRRADRG